MANKSFTIQYLIKARDKFSVAANKVSKAATRMKLSVASASKAFVKSSRAMQAAGAKMTAFVTAPILLMARSFSNAARDAEETRSKFKTVFKDIGVSAETQADTLAKSFGLTGTKARELVGDTADLLTGFNFSQEAALKMSLRVNELAVDLASFTNFSGGAEGASKALTKGLLGETESMKSLGIAILQKDVKAKVSVLLARGMTFETMRQAKAFATLELAVEQSKNAIGDYARTQHELANQQRLTSSRIQDMKESFGRVLMPVALKMTQVIRKFVKMLTNLSPQAKKVILVIAGIVAIIGPLLLIIGSIGLAIPVMITAFSTMGLVAAAALGPVGLIAAGIALAAFLIIKNWDKVKAFFSGFGKAISRTMGPTMTKLIDKFKESSKIIADFFGSDSEAFRNLEGFASMGQLMGEIVGGALDIIIRALSGLGEILGQIIASVINLDFSQFDTAAINAAFTGEQQRQAAIAPIAIADKSAVDVSVNVGLEKGLEQTGGALIGQSNKRADVGAIAR